MTAPQPARQHWLTCGATPGSQHRASVGTGRGGSASTLLQSATGFDLDQARAAGQAMPRALPMLIPDHAAGRRLTFGTLVALRHQASTGGSWKLRVALAHVGLKLRSPGRDSAGHAPGAP